MTRESFRRSCKSSARVSQGASLTRQGDGGPPARPRGVRRRRICLLSHDLCKDRAGMLQKIARDGSLASTFSPPAMQRARLTVAPLNTARAWLSSAQLPLSWRAARKGRLGGAPVLASSRVTDASRVSHVTGTASNVLQRTAPSASHRCQRVPPTAPPRPPPPTPPGLAGATTTW